MSDSFMKKYEAMQNRTALESWIVEEVMKLQRKKAQEENLEEEWPEWPETDLSTKEVIDIIRSFKDIGGKPCSWILTPRQIEMLKNMEEEKMYPFIEIGKPIKLREQKRVYTYVTEEGIPFFLSLLDVRELIVRLDGSHRIKTANGRLHWVAPGFHHIEVTDEKKYWTV